MTTASNPTTAETVELSTDAGTAFLTGAEIDAIEADPVLTLTDVLAHRSRGDQA